MTDTQIKDAIADVLGYERVPDPNWLNSLDACRELWEFIRKQSSVTKREFFKSWDNCKSEIWSDALLTLLLTSPREHCIAFLKAMGRWVE